MKLWVDGVPHKLRLKVTVLGRDPAADVPVVHAEVSRKHAVVVSLGEDRYLLMDFKSANGTKLNGRRIETAELRDGDQIDLAGALVTIEEERRRQGSLAATGRYKSLLEMESATSEEGASRAAAFWNERLEETHRLLPAVNALRQARDLDEACELVLRASMASVDADRGLLLLLDDDGAALRLKTEAGFPQGRGIRRNLHQALVDEAVDNDRIVTTGPEFMREVFSSVSTAPGQGRVPDVAGAMAAPLSVCSRHVGALVLDRKGHRSPFQARDRTMMRFLSELCSSHLAGLLLEHRLEERRGQVEIVDVVLQRTGPGNCEVCGEGLQELGSPLVACHECETQYHEDCWAFLGKCAIFACESALAARVGGGRELPAPGPTLS
jgi:hypothetical protein